MFLLSILLQTLILERVFSLPLLDGEESKSGAFFYQYAVLIHTTSDCYTCQKHNKNCSTELDNFVKYDFPGYTVKVKHKTFLCEGHNGDNIVLLRLHLSPTKEQEDSGTELQRMLECSGHLPSGKDSEPCSYYTTNSPPVRDKSTFDRDLIAVLVTVFVAVEMLVLAVLMYWKRKEVTTLAKRWTAQCRNGEADERVPLLGDPPQQPLPSPHIVQLPVQENNDSFDRAEWARRVLEQPFIGPRWASPVARVTPLPHQTSDSESSTASSTSRLFDALIEAPTLRKRVSSERSLDCQGH